MKYFIVYAHPEPRSLSGHFKDRAVQALKAAGHDVIVSDLYAMKWKAVADADDFPERHTDEPLRYVRASREAYTSGTQTNDVVAEQEKLLWADAVVLQFPLWWYGMPAILKGWIDRVYACGFAYGVGPHGGTQWGVRFGEGALQGRRAMVAVNIGGRMSHYGPRGVCGAIDDILWPIQHGVLFYPGMVVAPPAIFYQVAQANEPAIADMADTYIRQLLDIFAVEPIPFRTQNGGDYDGMQVLKAELDNGRHGHGLHQRDPIFISNTWLGEGEDIPRHVAPTSRTPRA